MIFLTVSFILDTYKPMPQLLFLLILFCLTPTWSISAQFYIDPINGSHSNNGSSAAPWKSLQRLFDENFIESRQWDSLPHGKSSFLVPKNPGAPIKSGDTIFLRTGQYGELEITQYYNSGQIYIVADLEHTPLFSNIITRSSSNWTMAGLSINPSAFGAGSFSNLISLESHSWTGPVHAITVKNCTVKTVSNSKNWSRADWNNKAKNGIRVDGKNMTITGNSFMNVNFGISVNASHSLIEKNSVINFAGDGMRGLGDYSIFQYNTVKNSYDVNDNHDDGFQSWSLGNDGRVGTGTVRGIILRGNTIINYEDPNQPFRGTLQGIGCFDGMFADWIVEKNIVKVDHWHGISLYGAINTLIRDNIVTDANTNRSIGPPWIMLNSHKNGTVSENSEVSCNIAPNIIIRDGINILVEHNTLSETGGPRHPQCPGLVQIGPLLPLLLEDN